MEVLGFIPEGWYGDRVGMGPAWPTQFERAAEPVTGGTE
jgi:hypothetical protein